MVQISLHISTLSDQTFVFLSVDFTISDLSRQTVNVQITDVQSDLGILSLHMCEGT